MSIVSSPLDWKLSQCQLKNEAYWTAEKAGEARLIYTYGFAKLWGQVCVPAVS